MAIQKSDIKLYKSLRMDGTPQGAGPITGNVVNSGTENELFSDISRLDRTYGRCDIRQVFAAVDTDSVEKYIGSHCFISEIPNDPNVITTLFTTKNWDAKYTDLRDYIERYLTKGPKQLGYLFERQLTGQQSILLWMREAYSLPDVGSVLCLVGDEGKVTEYEQYVKISKVESQLQAFYDDKGQYIVKVVTITLTDPLLYDFTGVAPARYDTALTPQSTMRKTIPTNAARYYGTKPLAINASIGQGNVVVNSLYTQLVPAAQSEFAIQPTTAGTNAEAIVESGKGTPIIYQISTTFSPSIGIWLGTGVAPGSLSIITSSGTITDSGTDLKLNGSTIGTAQYSQGFLQLNSTAPTISGTKTISFRTATAVSKVADTASIAIVPETRGLVYTQLLHPKPSPGTLSVDYMTEGKWYRLSDRGDGVCVGTDASHGVATVSYSTGYVSLSCGALPDNNSKIVLSWGTPVSTFNRSNITPPTPEIRGFLNHFPVAPNSVNISWNSVSVSDDGSGNLSGTGGTGTIHYSTGKIFIKPTVLPLGGTSFLCDYSYGDPIEELFPHPSRNGEGELVLMLNTGNITPKSVEIEFNVLIDDYEAVTTTSSEFTFVRSNWVDPIVISRDNGSGAFTKGIPVEGSINYTAGEIVITPEYICSIPKPIYSNHPLGTETTTTTSGLGTTTIATTTYRRLFDGWEYIPAPAKFPIDETGYVKVRYRGVDTPQSVIDEEHQLPEMFFDLTDNYNERIVESSVRFDFGGKTYFDQDGYLYHSLNPANGSATQAGVINYQSGMVQITDYTAGATNSFTLHSLLTQNSAQAVDEVVFRTPKNPVRVGSFYIQANQLNGNLISCTADNDGTIITSNMDGVIDYEYGLVRIRFGAWVVAAGNESQPWYDETAIRVDGKIFKPVPVYPESITFTCVVYSYLPLSAEIIGIDPVRLPIDGKVVIYKRGDLVIVHDKKTTTCSNPVSAGQTVNCGRQRLTYAEVRDANSKVLAPDLYTDDLDAGTITFANPLNLTEYVQPLVVHHSVSDMSILTDTEISGTLSLSKPLSHNYSKLDTYVSSALVMKPDGEDLFARYTDPFARSTWTNDWPSESFGSAIASKYDAVNYPIVLTNAGCITQKWALIFTSTTAFRIVGNTLGEIGTGNINTQCALINPNSGTPYFTLSQLGWGTGWSVGNVVRFNTTGANYPIDIIRTILQSEETGLSDHFAIQINGDIDD